MKKRYRIRKGSIADFTVSYIVPGAAFAIIIIFAGLMNSWELGLL